jgi:hypothetical protein
MTNKNPAEPKLDKIRITPKKISLFEPAKFYDQKLKGSDREHMRRSESAGS